MTRFGGIRISTERSNPTEHNIHIGLVTGMVSRSAVPPTPAVGPVPGHISATPKPWQAFAHGITNPDAAEAPRLHLGGLLLGEQRVSDEPIPVEHGVVEAHPERVGEWRKPVAVPEDE